MSDYTIIEYNGQQARKYPDGSIRRDNGTLLARPDALLEHAITPENAKEFHRMRKEKILQAVESGVMRVVDAPNPYEAISRIVEKRAQVAMSDDGRSGNEAAKIVLLALDALQDKRQETTVTDRKEYSIDADTMRVVEQMIQARRSVIDGEIIE